MKYIIYIFILFATCKNQQINEDEILIREVSRKYISDIIKKNTILSNNIILDIEGEYWKSKLNYTHLSMVSNFGAKQESDLVNFYKIFNTNNLYDLNSNREYKKWSQVFPNLTFSKKKESDLSISLPILSKDRNYAIFYVSKRYSGSLVVYKKVDNKWQYFAIGNVWIS